VNNPISARLITPDQHSYRSNQRINVPYYRGTGMGQFIQQKQEYIPNHSTIYAIASRPRSEVKQKN